MNEIIQIIGNNDYLLTDDLKVLITNKAAKKPKENGNDVFLSLYNNPPKWYDKQWLKLLTYYNLRLKKEYEKFIDYFKFVEFDPSYRTVDKHIVILTKPVYHSKLSGYRMIARYPNYFINDKGVIYDDAKGKYYTEAHKSKGVYPKISLRDQSGITLYSSCSMHKLVALTWIENDDYKAKPILDHIDGNKHNYAASNLRWVSYKENATLSYEQNLKNNCIPATCKNIDTGETLEFSSLTKLKEYIGIGQSTVNKDMLDSKAIWKTKKGRFIIKIIGKESENDTTPKIDKDDYIGSKQTSEILITIYGETKSYINWREVKTNVLKFDARFSYTIPMIVKKVKNKDPNAIIVYKKYDGVVAEREDERVEAKTTLELSNKLGIPKSTIIGAVIKGKLVNGWKITKKYTETKLTE